ncbi:DUF4232 domain-containing protein [Streptomyces mexicanus]|uniref:DUF4232 domain-containing protein n=1 Tax=Streptomyces mexicanus TaxID=178566 RepID=A0A7X1HVG4_9ACTN|nr:DUF4232 domain-containing protein [Streptomyces mexicanus]MBC2863914.1 DUF4232 domain-containing protein [Streptomyces mexicanus]
MSVRTARRLTRTRLFAATALSLAALSLTACENGTDSASAGSATTATAQGDHPSTASSGQGSASSGQGSAGTGNEGGKNASSGTDGTGGSGGTGAAEGTSGNGKSSTGSGTAGTVGTAGSARTGGTKTTGGSTGSRAGAGDSSMPGTCSARTTRIKATLVSRPINHLLLTATNTGSKTCMLPPYPAARFGEAQSVPPVAEDTKPQALTGMEPGQSAYAGVLLSAGDGSAEHGHTVHSLTVPFTDGSIATVALPAQGVYVDDSLTVTYWLPEMGQALEH